jgi:hypothetical protein
MGEINIKGQYQPKVEAKRVYKLWMCRCGQEVMAYDKPQPIKWTDGHTCNFDESREQI